MLSRIFEHPSDVKIIESILEENESFTSNDIHIKSKINIQNVRKTLHKLMTYGFVIRERHSKDNVVYTKTDEEFWNKLKELIELLAVRLI